METTQRILGKLFLAMALFCLAAVFYGAGHQLAMAAIMLGMSFALLNGSRKQLDKQTSKL